MPWLQKTPTARLVLTTGGWRRCQSQGLSGFILAVGRILLSRTNWRWLLWGEQRQQQYGNNLTLKLCQIKKWLWTGDDRRVFGLPVTVSPLCWGDLEHNPVSTNHCWLGRSTHQLELWHSPSLQGGKWDNWHINDSNVKTQTHDLIIDQEGKRIKLHKLIIISFFRKKTNAQMTNCGAGLLALCGVCEHHKQLRCDVSCWSL